MLAEILLLLSNKKSQSLVCFVILFMTSTPMTKLTPVGILKCCNIRHKKQLTGKLVLPLLLWGTINNCGYKGLRFFSTDSENQSQSKALHFSHLFSTCIMSSDSHHEAANEFHRAESSWKLKSNSLAQVTRNTILYVLP